MKCKRCGQELDFLDVCETGGVFECGECAYTLILTGDRDTKVFHSGPQPLDYYFHD
jgi:hypothetical protein